MAAMIIHTLVRILAICVALSSAPAAAQLSPTQLKAQRERAARAAAINAQAERARAAAAATARAQQAQTRRQPAYQAHDLCKGFRGTQVYDECFAEIIANRRR